MGHLLFSEVPRVNWKQCEQNFFYLPSQSTSPAFKVCFQTADPLPLNFVRWPGKELLGYHSLEFLTGLEVIFNIFCQ